MAAAAEIPTARSASKPESSKVRVLCYEFDLEKDVIGKGAYGEVYKATVVGPPGNNMNQIDGAQGSFVALKRTFCADKEEGIPASTIREIMVLNEIVKSTRDVAGPGSPALFGSENVVKLYDVVVEKYMVYMASEYCEAGDLSCYLNALPLRRLTDGRLYRQWMRDLLSGLCFLHRKEFSHRDLKPQNLVLKAVPPGTQSPRVNCDGEPKRGPRAPSQYVLKITDFGLSRVEGIPVKKYQHESVTLWYRSPDVLLGNTNYNYTVDLWSAGCIIAEVASGKALFHGGNNLEQLKCIFALLGLPTGANFPSMKQYALYKDFFNGVNGIQLGQNGNDGKGSNGYSDWLEGAKRKLHYYFTRCGSMDMVGNDGVDLVARLLAYEPDRRITAEEALQHPFFCILSRGISSPRRHNFPQVTAAAEAGGQKKDLLLLGKKNAVARPPHRPLSAVLAQNRHRPPAQPREGEVAEAEAGAPNRARVVVNTPTPSAGVRRG
ncbi:protein kinase [Trypanosoma conorhini]|uniref:Protein kinase n=1 Tax=Trypanosoma conorhini TaxID=83891 RepID=A0A3R7MF04_9TRYP|nr:protein kinase [Trypanosoma conorhini]RNF14000.1 protein kinase [Trypanosoma conorhini]